MKLRQIITLAAITIFGIALTTSCNKEETAIPQEQINSNLEGSSWYISSFIDSGNDETYHFNGYTFTFAESGVLTATNGTNTYTGTWSITTSSSQDDSTDDMDFNIYFNLTNNFEDLNDDWDIITNTTSMIELMDISGGNGGTDYLTFVKK